jgi:hypothetical protein
MRSNDAYPPAYDKWGGNPTGNAPDYARCCETVRESGVRFPHYVQCHRKRGYGPGEAYCKQHDPVAVEARRAAADERYAAQTAKRRTEWAGPTFLAALRQIAAGHNDARGLAREVVEKFDAGGRKRDS